MIQAINLFKSYESLRVLNDVTVSIRKGEVVSIVGPSGAGKTTLLHILGTLDKADKGSLEINNVTIASLTTNKLAEFRNKNIGFVFQFHHLLPEFTALENICIPAFIAGIATDEAKEKANQLLSYYHF
jgi:lipoprotein-releasing system ATP-binding protein